MKRVLLIENHNKGTSDILEYCNTYITCRQIDLIYQQNSYSIIESSFQNGITEEEDGEVGGEQIYTFFKIIFENNKVNKRDYYDNIKLIKKNFKKEILESTKETYEVWFSYRHDRHDDLFNKNKLEWHKFDDSPGNILTKSNSDSH